MKKGLQRILCLLLCLLFVSNLETTTALAGKSEKVTTAQDAEGLLNNSEWNYMDTNIIAENGKVVIPADTSSRYTRIISRNVASVDKGSGEFITMTSKLKLTKLPEGEQFILAFGLGSVEAGIGESGNVELVFMNKGKLVVSVIAYSEQGAVTVLEERDCGVRINSAFTLEAAIDENSILRLDINNRNLCKKELPVNGSGRVGVLQTGKCGAEITQLSAKYRYYDRPENVNIKEDFESGEWNANLLTARSFGATVWDGGMTIEEMDGNKVLLFRNTSYAFFGTALPYSNFELSFDVPYVQLKNEVDEAGNITKKASQPLYLSFGDLESDTVNKEGYSSSMDLLLFRYNSASSFLRKHYSVSLAEKGLPVPTDSDTVWSYSVKIRMVDGVLDTYVKPLSGTKWTSVATADYGDNFCTGYIKIWSSLNAYFAIDNFTVTNLDVNPNLKEVDYKTSIMVVEDYELTEEEKELKFRKEAVKEEPKESDINFEGLILAGSATGSIVLIIVGLIVRTIMKRKSERGSINEKE